MHPVGRRSFGLYTLDAAADYLDVSMTTLTTAIRDGYLPERYADKVIDMGSLAMLPIDEPPEADAIGHFAHLAMKHLMRGEALAAIGLAELGLQKKPMDWPTASPVDCNALQIYFCRLVRGLAWARNPHASELKCGLPALRKLHQEVRRHMRSHRIDHRTPHWPAWRYLAAMAAGGALCYFVMFLGQRWFANPVQEERLKNAEYRKRKAEFLIRGSSQLLEVKPMFGKQRHVTVRIAWNMAQLAALAQCENTFLEALKVLHAKLYKTFDAVVDALLNDHDTRPMLAMPLVAIFLKQVQGRLAA